MSEDLNKPMQCAHCGASLKKYWHTLSPLLCHTLLKFRAVALVQNNKVHLAKDLNLSKTEYANAQKLRYWGLIYFTDESGKWLMTRNGNRWAKGEILMPKKILTFRNHIEEKSREMVSIKDVLKADMPYLETDFAFELADIDYVPSVTFDASGNGLLF